MSTPSISYNSLDKQDTLLHIGLNFQYYSIHPSIYFHRLFFSQGCGNWWKFKVRFFFYSNHAGWCSDSRLTPNIIIALYKFDIQCILFWILELPLLYIPILRTIFLKKIKKLKKSFHVMWSSNFDLSLFSIQFYRNLINF